MKLLLAVLACAVAAAAQGPPSPDLMATMQQIVQALGVNCDYCHSAPRGSGEPEPKKDIARAMMAMTREINERVQSASGKTAGAAARVECVTCHRGVAIPRQLADIITDTLRQKGAEAAAAQYRDLRAHYYGRQTYDFGEATLIGIAQRIASGRPDDAIALLKVNLEFNPRSVQTMATIAFAYTRKLDDDAAMSYLQKALEIEPENGVVRGQLEQLQSYHRKR